MKMWAWVPTLEESLDFLGKGLLADTDIIKLFSKIAKEDDSLSKSNEDLIICNSFRKRELGVILTLEKEKENSVSVNILNLHNGFELLYRWNLTLDKFGLLCLDDGEYSTDKEIPKEKKELSEWLIYEKIIPLYHIHAHHIEDSLQEGYSVKTNIQYEDDKIQAIESIYRNYLDNIISNVKILRDSKNSKGKAYLIKGEIDYGLSFVDKYGISLEDQGSKMRYLNTHLVDSIYQTEYYRVAKLNEERAKSIRSINFLSIWFLIVSIAVAFFAGSILNDSVPGDTKWILTCIGALSFLIIGLIIGLYWKFKILKPDD